MCPHPGRRANLSPPGGFYTSEQIVTLSGDLTRTAVFEPAAATLYFPLIQNADS